MNRVRAATRVLLPNWSPYPPACVAALRRPGYLGAIPGDLLELIRLHFPDAWRDHAAEAASRKAQLAAILPIDYARGKVPRASLLRWFSNKNIGDSIKCEIKLIGRYAAIYCGEALVFVVLSTGELHKKIMTVHDCSMMYVGMGAVRMSHEYNTTSTVSADCDAVFGGVFNGVGSYPPYIFPCGLRFADGVLVHPINRSSVDIGQDNEINVYIRRCWGHDCYGLYDCSTNFKEIKLK